MTPDVVAAAEERGKARDPKAAGAELLVKLGGRLLDLVSEVGELSKEALKASEYGAKNFKPTTAWTEEMGDVLFSLICVANISGVDLEEALKSVVTKYRARMFSKPSPESGR